MAQVIDLQIGDLVSIKNQYDYSKHDYVEMQPKKAILLAVRTLKNEDETTNDEYVFITEDGDTPRFFNVYGFDVESIGSTGLTYEYQSARHARLDFSEGLFAPYFA